MGDWNLFDVVGQSETSVPCVVVYARGCVLLRVYAISVSLCLTFFLYVSLPTSLLSTPPSRTVCLPVGLAPVALPPCPLFHRQTRC